MNAVDSQNQNVKKNKMKTGVPVPGINRNELKRLCCSAALEDEK